MPPFALYPQPIPDGALDLTPVQVDFTGDFANIIGNAGTPSDGFDAVIAGPTQYIIDHPTIVAGMDSDLNDTGVATGDLNTPFHQDFADSLAGFIQQGDPDFQQYNVHLAGNNPPPPGPGPGTATCSGGSTSGVCNPAVAGAFPNVDCWQAHDMTDQVNSHKGHGTYQVAVPVFEHNSGKVAVVQSAVFLSKDDAQWQRVFVDPSPCTETGHPCGFIVAFDPLTEGKTKAVVQATCAGTPTKRNICLEITVLPHV